MSIDQRTKIVSLLETAKKLAFDLEDGTLAYLVERALDQARANLLRDELKPKPP